MKKQFVIFVSVVLFLVLGISCSRSTQPIETKTEELSSHYFLNNDSSRGTLSVDIQVELPVKSNANSVSNAVRESIISFIFGEKYSGYSNESILTPFYEDIKEEYIANYLPLVEELDSSVAYAFNNEYSYNGYTLFSDDKIFSYCIETYSYTGGAHGMFSKIVTNFDLKGDKILTESDLFIQGYESELTRIIKEELKLQLNEDNPNEGGGNLNEMDYWDDTIKPNGNFYITENSINYIYNQYEIAPYSTGLTEVELPFAKIMELLLPVTPIDYLIR